MPSPQDQTSYAESDHPGWQQCEDLSGLEDYDFDTFVMPNIPSLGRLPSMEAPPPQTAVQSPTISPQESCPQSQARRVSVITVQRPLGTRPNEVIAAVTLEEPNDKTPAWDVDFDSAYEAWWNSMSAELPVISEQLEPATSVVQPTLRVTPQSHELYHLLPQSQTMGYPLHASGPRMSTMQQVSYPTSYTPAASSIYQSTVPSIQFGEESLTLLHSQVAPILSNPPMPVAARRVGLASASSQSLRRQAHYPVGKVEHQKALERPRPSQQVFQREGRGGRPQPPDNIAQFVNPHHLPHNHGRVPDKRGNKDTTVANDYYYSIHKLDELELPTCGKTVSYNGVEFDAGLSFTGEEFIEYLQCASHRPSRRPILRIQIQPAQYNHRYIRAGQSFKCRFADCPDKRGTILKGQARVCISEFDDPSGHWLNPFHNAGYVHLFCLEQQVNLIELCDRPGLTLVPERRSLVHEPPVKDNIRSNNPMALNDVEQAVVDEWRTDIGNRWQAFKSVHQDVARRPSFVLTQEDTLTYRLTEAHMDNRSLRNTQKRRKIEAGGRMTAHLDEFIGDVGKQVSLQAKMRMKIHPSIKRPRADLEMVEQASSPQSLAKRRRVVTPPSYPAMLGEKNQINLVFSDLADKPARYSHGGPLPVRALLAQCQAPAVMASRSSSQCRRRPPPILLVRSPGVAKRRSSTKRTSSLNARLGAELLAYLEATVA